MRRLKPLEDENAKLRKVVADLSLDKEMLQDAAPPKALKPARKRKLVNEMRSDWNVSIRRACRVFLVDTSTYSYKSRHPGQAPLEQRIVDIHGKAPILNLAGGQRFSSNQIGSLPQMSSRPIVRPLL
jgi:putative transposase